ncbi:MAG: TonB family protein [Acidobacteria bacterium]|nr:TonB family protein [Acidobacteriota bacterium]
MSGSGVIGWPAAGVTPEQLRKPLLLSAAAHTCLAGLALLGVIVQRQGSFWGTGSSGGVATVRLVSGASVPLPAPVIATQNRVATENPGLHYPEPPQPAPQPKAEPPKPPAPEKAVELPARNAKLVPETPKKVIAKTETEGTEKTEKPAPKQEAKSAPEPSSRSQQQVRLRQPEQPAGLGNEIPYGQGGPVQGPYGIFQSNVGSGGINFGEGAGDFGIRYSWYVTAIRIRISSNWLQGTVDPQVRVAPRVYVAFQILRDGRIVNAQVTSSSGVPSLDRSALRAVYDSNPMPPLPADYPGSSVAVEFWFDFRR